MDDPPVVPKFRRFLRWLSPLRFRFWACTLPLLLIGTVSILFWWPGLEVDWKFNDDWAVQRASGVSFGRCSPIEMDRTASLRSGPLEIHRWTFKPGSIPGFEPEGFCTWKDPDNFMLGYSTAGSVSGITFKKDWRPW